jgi:3-oxoacyl-[acyl-carrier protein] reductase
MYIKINRGIGASIALRLARDGAKVIVNYQKDVKSANEVVKAINSIPNGAAIAIQADVTSSTQVCIIIITIHYLSNSFIS